VRLTRDLLFGSEGSLKFKSGLWNDIRTVIVPTLVDKVGMLMCVARATVHLVSESKTSVLKVKNVIVKVAALNFSIRDLKHDFL